MEFNVRQPAQVYEKLDVTGYRNIYVVGDLHGQYTRLKKALDDVGFEVDLDLLISVGDIIDRGSESIECLSLLKEPWFKMVRGNHEDFAIATVEETDDLAAFNWFRNGGAWFLKTEVGDERQVVMDSISSMGELPYVLEVTTDKERVVIAHSCYPRDTYQYDAPVNTFTVVWDRERYRDRRRGDRLTTKGADLFIHGHWHTSAVEAYGNHRYIATAMADDGEITLYKIQG